MTSDTVNKATELARTAYWCLRHLPSLRGLTKGASLRDLILREDLLDLGIRLSFEESRILGRSRLSVSVVVKLSRHFGRLSPLTVLDVGAQHGQFALASTLAFPECKVYSFEPMATSFASLKVVAEGRPQITPFRSALGAKDGNALLHLSANSGSSSMLPMLDSHTKSFPGTGTVGEERIQVHRLDSLVHSGEVVIKRPVLMKVDTQGFEDKVLDGASEVVDQVDALIIEMSLIPLYEGQVLAGPLRTSIEAFGLDYSGEFDLIPSPVSGEVCQIDGMFLRRQSPASPTTPTPTH